MGKMTMNGSAGGTPSDECTAIKGYVLAPYTAVTSDSGDEAVSGTMPNNGAWTGQIGVNGRVAVPTGYHSGSGYVGQSIPTQGGKTVTPGASQQTAVAAGRYVTGDIVVPGFALPAANTIKKGVTINIYGRTVTGTFEGWVPTANDLYVRGNNIAQFIIGSNCTLESGGIKLTGSDHNAFNCSSAGNINYVPYNYLNIEGYFEKRMKYLAQERNVVFNLCAKEYGKATIIAQSKTALPSNNSNFTRSIDIRNVALSKRSSIALQIDGEYYYDGNDGRYWNEFTRSGWQGYVYRIWLS